MKISSHKKSKDGSNSHFHDIDIHYGVIIHLKKPRMYPKGILKLSQILEALV